MIIRLQGKLGLRKQEIKDQNTYNRGNQAVYLMFRDDSSDKNT